MTKPTGWHKAELQDSVASLKSEVESYWPEDVNLNNAVNLVERLAETVEVNDD